MQGGGGVKYRETGRKRIAHQVRSEQPATPAEKTPRPSPELPQVSERAGSCVSSLQTLTSQEAAQIAINYPRKGCQTMHTSRGGWRVPLQGTSTSGVLANEEIVRQGKVEFQGTHK